MKFRYFIVCCIIFMVTSIYIFLFERKRPVIIGLVSRTNKQFDSLRSFKQDLKEASEKLLNVDKKYMTSLGFRENPLLYPEYFMRNVTLPVIVTYAKSGQEEQAVSFVRNIAHLLPEHLTLMYNIGLKTYELFLLQGFCSSNHCLIRNFDLDLYPPHVRSDVSLFRPLIIQDALTKVGAIFFMECDVHLLSSNIKNVINKAKKNGIVTWQSKYPTSTVTHPKMFEYFKTSEENFYFVPAIETSKLILYNTKTVHHEIMYPWIKCILVRSCVLPIGAQNSGCQYDKKPQYRYSGCHLNDASALSVVLGQHFSYDSSQYSCTNRKTIFRDVSVDDAKLEISMLLQNNSEKNNAVSKWIL